MTTSENEFNPQKNLELIKLREKWEAGHFTLDEDSVYGVDEIIRDASKQLDSNPVTALSNNDLPKHKTCQWCKRSSRNYHCDECYNMIRYAAEHIPPRSPFKSDLHPCHICEEGQILTAICPDCMDLLLGL